MKKFLALLLALTMLLSLGVAAHADEHADEHVHLGNEDIGQQLTFIGASFKDLKQDDSDAPWHYAVTDLDHNGRLELLAINNQSHKLKAWEISPNGKSLVPCQLPYVPLPAVENAEELYKDSFAVELFKNSVDTYFDAAKNIYFYIFVDSIEISVIGDVKTGGEFVSVVSGSTVTSMNAVSFKNGIFNNAGLGMHASYDVGDGDLKVICRNSKAEDISQEEFYNIPAKTFAGMTRFSTAFDWFEADEAKTLERLVKSYATFDGVYDPEHEDEGIRLLSSQNYSGVYVTKNPTDEKHNPGETAEFIANANIWDSLEWVFVSPDETKFLTPAQFADILGCRIKGEDSADILIYDTNTAMNGWTAYCTFYYRGAIARTSSAALYIWQGANPSQKNVDLDMMIGEFYHQKPYLRYGWDCPLCGAAVYGTTYCTSCGFNPYTFYYNYYGVELDDSGYYYIGEDYYTPLDNLTPAPIDTTYAWTCPVCGQNNRGTDDCWNCSYHYGAQVKAPTVQLELGNEVMQCRNCGGWFNCDFDRCPYCGYEPDNYGQDLVARQCQYCGYFFNSDFDVCPNCGNAPDDNYYGYTNYYYEEPTYDTNYWNCPLCGAGNQGGWNCWSCGYVYGSAADLYEAQIDANTINEFMQGAELIQCQNCGEWFNSDYDSCPYCGMVPGSGSYGYSDVGIFDGYTPGGNARYIHYDAAGNEYETVICPVCGYEHSMATNCPICGSGYT